MIWSQSIKLINVITNIYNNIYICNYNYEKIYQYRRFKATLIITKKTILAKRKTLYIKDQRTILSLLVIFLQLLSVYLTLTSCGNKISESVSKEDNIYTHHQYMHIYIHIRRKRIYIMHTCIYTYTHTYMYAYKNFSNSFISNS